MPILKKDKPGSALIHIDTNDTNNHKLHAVSPEKLASDIIETGRTCKSFNVKQVFISSALWQNEVNLCNQINRTNELLNKLCKENGFIYISNSNITPSHLSKDGIHLNVIGTFKLGDNFVKHVNVSGSYLNARNAWLPVSDRILVDNKFTFKMQKVDTEPYLSTNSHSNLSDALTEIRIKNPKQLIIAHLNIKSLRVH